MQAIGCARLVHTLPIARLARAFVGWVLVMLAVSWPIAYGQSDCPFADSVAVADTLDPRGYYPTQVGNVWDYVVRNHASLDNPRRVEIVSDTLIDGMTFFKRRLTFFQYENSQVISRSTTFIDFIAVVDSGFVEWRNESKDFMEFRFNVPFNSCYRGVRISGGYRTTFSVEENGEEVIIELPASKGFEGAHFAEEYGHGIGRILQVGDPSLRAELTYFRVNDVEVGTPLDSLFTIVVSVEDSPSLPRERFRLQSYPNPFNALTQFSFSLTRSGLATLQIVDMLGRVVAQPLANTHLAAGTHVIRWKAGQVPSGVYLAQLAVDGRYVATARLLRIK